MDGYFLSRKFRKRYRRPRAAAPRPAPAVMTKKQARARKRFDRVAAACERMMEAVKRRAPPQEVKGYAADLFALTSTVRRLRRWGIKKSHIVVINAAYDIAKDYVRTSNAPG